ncbi:MAG TPA: trypsin-like peptidase domain-containing protein [Thermoanaerobaculia bacterium]|nr:trypsin-like peptidase domain-containing protein [Thermoanaerobaculia bacterium]
MNHLRRRSALVAALLAFGLFHLATFATDARAQSIQGFQMPAAPAPLAAPAPALRLEAAMAQAPLHTLPPASVGAADLLASLQAWNAAGKQPLRNGFARTLASPGIVRLSGPLGGSAPQAAPRPFAGGLLTASAAGELAWGTRVTVQDAYRLRLHLSDVHLPAGTRMWVEAPGGPAHEFGLELLSPLGDLWTPSVKGESLLFEVHVPAGAAAASFAVREVMELIQLGPGGGGASPLAAPPGDPACIVDASCPAATSALPNLAAKYRHAVAQLIFVEPGQIFSFFCSGGLLNNTRSDGTPYLLTANHCFADQYGASSLEATFDFYTASCNAATPDETTFPVANGGLLLATGTTSDFTFVRLYGVPAGRYLLGWNANASALTQGTSLYRLSFPFPLSQPVPDPERFSQSTFQTGNNIPVCDQPPPGEIPRPRPDYIYASLVKGGTFGGSSGAPLLLGDGKVVGQLFGGCAFAGHDVNNGCDYANSELDGAFSVSFPSLAPWLAPSVSPGACVPDATTLCIDRNPGDRRFKVKVSFATVQGGGLSGSGNAIPLSSLGLNEGGMFWFFAANNPEMLVKIIDGCGLNSHFWVFYAATTNVGFTLSVTDTVALNQQIYANQDQGAAVPVQDTAALPCP